jgi:hypothetical protein
MPDWKRSVAFLVWAQPTDLAGIAVREARFEKATLALRIFVAKLCALGEPMTIARHVAAIETAHRHVLRSSCITLAISAPVKASRAERISRPAFIAQFSRL